jgi:hypothetical protein
MEMSNRSARFVSAVIASILAGANFAAVAENAPADTKAADSKPADTKAVADNCLSGPKGSLPAGGHWYYHLDRATKRNCWYIGEDKGKTAKAAPAAQDPSSAAGTADSAPPPQSASLRKSVADARAELPSSQTNVVQDTTAGIAQQTTRAANVDNSPRAAAANADTQQSSTVSSRWPEASSVPPSGSFQLAAANASANAQADPQPAPPPTVTPAAPAASGSALDRQSYSTQMLLLVMISALALAGLVSAAILRLNRARKPADEFRSEWPAPWDSIHSDLAPQPMFRLEEAPTAPAEEAPTRREHSTRREHEMRREHPLRRATASHDPRAPDDPDRRIAEMLQRLARSAAT